MLKDKVIFINIFEGSTGGGEVYLKRLINGIRDHISAESLLLSPSCTVLQDVTINRIIIPGIHINGKTTIIQYIRSIISIRRLIKHHKPKIVVINGDRAIALSMFFGFKGRKIGIKHMLINNRIKYLINFFGFNCLSSIVTISKYHKQNYVKWFGKKVFDKIKVIYNAVDTQQFSPTNIIDEKKIRFIEVASIEKRKGQKDLILAFHNLKQKYKNIELFFYGVGPSLTEYKQFVQQLGTNDVNFVGFVDNIDQIYRYTPSIFVLPSYNKGLPISILEAMSSGLPVISTNIAGIPEAVLDGVNGYLINPGDIGSLTLKMEQFILDMNLIKKFGKNSRSLILNSFDQNDWIESWCKILQ